MKSIWGVLIGSCAIGLVAQGCIFGHRVETKLGPMGQEDRAVKPFTKIVVQGAASIVWVQGDKVAINVKAYEEGLKATTTEVNGDTLVIAQKPHTHFHGEVLVIITALDLTQIDIEGAADFSTSSLKTKKLDVTIKGSGNLTLKGTAKTARYTVDGTGSINALAFKTEDLVTTINGAASAKVFASQSLRVEVNGAGTVQYDGKPKSFSKSGNGVSTVQEL